MNPTGTHIFAEYSGCDPAILDNCGALAQLLAKSAEICGATVVTYRSVRLNNDRVICLVVLQESHLSIHTCRKNMYAAVDFYTCGKCDPHKCHPLIEAGLSAKSSQIILLERGLPGTPKMRVRDHRAVDRTVVDRSNSTLPRKTEGTHVLVEYSGCDSGILDDRAAVESLLVRAAESTGAIIIDSVMHRFLPHGVTGCIILDDAHLTIHTWPEVGYASVDFYALGHRDPYCIHAILAEALRSEQSEILVVDRGLASPEKIRIRGFRRVFSCTNDRH